MDPRRLDDLARSMATGMRRRTALIMLMGIAAGSLLGRLSPYLVGRAAAQACSQDIPTAASLQAARTALAGGATDVALSPGGCVRYRRWSTSTPVGAWANRELISYGGQTITEWNHNVVSATPPHSPFPPPPFFFIVSTGTRDGNLDGFAEWQATIQRVIPLSTIAGPLRTAIEITEYDPNSRLPVRRWTKTYPGDGTVHVKLEEGAGSLQVISEYDRLAVVENNEPAPATLNGHGVVAVQATSPVSIPCPAGLETEVRNLLPFAGGNGGGCLHSLGFIAEAAVLAQNSLRNFTLGCAKGSTGWQAQIDTASADDPLRAIELKINLDSWADPSRRETILFHELLHTVFADEHAAPLEGSSKGDDARWREFDRIGSCNSLCYNPNATKCECATCFGKKICDAPCDSLKGCYSTQRGGFCPCKDEARKLPERWYASFTECVTECPKGTKCFGVQCIQEENACK